jgi:hypothetical protein
VVRESRHDLRVQHAPRQPTNEEPVIVAKYEDDDGLVDILMSTSAKDALAYIRKSEPKR